MSKYKYSKTEQQINDVLKYHDEELKKLKAARPFTSELDRRIQESEDLLRMLGHTEMPTASKRSYLHGKIYVLKQRMLLVQEIHLNQSSRKRSLKQIPRKSVCLMRNIISSIV